MSLLSASPTPSPTSISTPTIMRAGSTRRIVHDSDSEREDDQPCWADTGDNSSGLESEAVVVQKKRGRKPKPKLPPAAPPTADEDHLNGKHKGFLWSNYPTQVAYLEKVFDNIIAADPKERHQKKKKLKQIFFDKYGPLRDCTRKEFDSILNNWLKNRLQFPNLCKVQPTLTSEAANTTDDESPSLAATAQPHLASATLVFADAPGAPLDALPDVEKTFWEQKAAEEKEKLSQDPPQCFKNQTDFPLLAANLLGSFFGYNADQVGYGLAHLRMALRNKAGGIEHVQYTIGLPDGAEAFDIYAGGPTQDDIDRWGHFVDEYLPQNPVPHDERLTYNADGLPKLPHYNDEWTVAEARSALDAWFHAMWQLIRSREEYALEHEIDVPHGLDWSNFQNTVAPHVPPRWRGDVSGKPSELPFHCIVTLYHDIFEAQDTEHTFRWLPSTSSTTVVERLPVNPPPHTPSKTIRTTYTMPTKNSTPRREPSRPRDRPPLPPMLSTRPLARPVFPTLETIPDTDEHLFMPFVAPIPLEPVNQDDQERGSATVEAGSQVNVDAGVAAHADSATEAGTVPAVDDAAAVPSDTGLATDKGTATSVHVGASTISKGWMHEAGDAARGEDVRDVPAVDSDSLQVEGAIPGGASEPHDDANVQPDAPAAGGHNTETGTAIRRSKRKQQERPSESMAKCAKASAGEIEPNSISATSHRSARPKQAPPVSPRKTRGRTEREAREAISNTWQTRAQRGGK
ncbi:hypothetical protein LXA43DRAFT_1068193 [Ganoderma leucocontextum]|nr:hypothetical protein LXA43DRAFT_1068193 [Ganoderma leucocontextum]